MDRLRHLLLGPILFLGFACSESDRAPVARGSWTAGPSIETEESEGTGSEWPLPHEMYVISHLIDRTGCSSEDLERGPCPAGRRERFLQEEVTVFQLETGEIEFRHSCLRDRLRLNVLRPVAAGWEVRTEPVAGARVSSCREISHLVLEALDRLEKGRYLILEPAVGEPRNPLLDDGSGSQIRLSPVVIGEDSPAQFH